MEKLKLFILALTFITSYSIGQNKTINAQNSELDNFYWIDTIQNGSIDLYENMYFYKESRASKVTMISEKREYFSRLYNYFSKHLPELGKIIDFGKEGYDKIKVVSSTVDDKKSCNCILLSLNKEHNSFNKLESVLMVIKRESYTLKIICPLP